VGTAVTAEVVAGVKDYLEEETLLPYFFDVIHFESISNAALRQHITTHGWVIP